MTDQERIARLLALIDCTMSPISLSWLKAQIERWGLIDRLGGEVAKRARELEAEGFDIELYGLEGDKAA